MNNFIDEWGAQRYFEFFEIDEFINFKYKYPGTSEELSIIGNLDSDFDFDNKTYIEEERKREWWLIDHELTNIHTFLVGYSKWRRLLDELYDHQRIEYIENRINLVKIALKSLDNDEVSGASLYSIAKIEMTPDLLKELSTLNKLLSFEDKNVLNLVEENSYTSELSLNDATSNFLTTVNLSRISKAVFHSGLLEKYSPTPIAEWLSQNCNVVKDDKTVATIESIAKQISNVKNDNQRRGNKNKLKAEIDFLKQYVKID